MRRLNTFVHVGGEAYGPGDEVPAEIAEQIGDHAWADTADVADGQGADGQGDEGQGDSDALDAPPRSGRGSGIDAWRRFAEQNSVEYATDASREDIIAAAEAAGVVEPEQPKE
ncbi:hypothetical protein [Streptomyces chryseus]|uniref:hypothetical protein n=1 Tax=Streptomyces chryseus TaxID=68186 RepID=UPI0019977DA0|nr:hypothetical protein [Streptomyces chryseus]GGX01941.1 hypothetical protein GCM10010353_16950 [Streptomyces chryseus]